ncbi:hypothetical protein BDY17DRAFT_188625 [Neohortaea acidophila]|uniref:Uncharacterized protein n=1 Tax=Neohortaea acidophila TaxID=245834 RepID=A0A6A6PP13_9PEZI|nr:uncharacterized protein BDY17DRAFT_188625 [Neohortaea acidophila]KAF2481431.1 hypothetical protein BDY17DRAFT_188625 [Neohortaea acidophila]
MHSTISSLSFFLLRPFVDFPLLYHDLLPGQSTCILGSMSSVRNWIAGWFETSTEPQQTPSPPTSPVVRSIRPIPQRSGLRHAPAVPASKAAGAVLATHTPKAPATLVPAKRVAPESLDNGPNKRIRQPGGTDSQIPRPDVRQPFAARTRHDSSDNTPGVSDGNARQTITPDNAGEAVTLTYPTDHGPFQGEVPMDGTDPQLEGKIRSGGLHHARLQDSSHALRKKVTAYLNTKRDDNPAPSTGSDNIVRKRKFPWDVEQTTSSKKRARVAEDRRLLTAKRQITPPRDGKQQLRLGGLWSRESWKCSGPRGLDLLIRK